MRFRLLCFVVLLTSFISAQTRTQPKTQLKAMTTLVSGSPSVSLTCTPPSGSPAPANAFNFYRSTVNGGPYTKLTASPVSTCAYTDSTVVNSTTYYYVATSVNLTTCPTGQVCESGNSNQATAVIPSPLQITTTSLPAGGVSVAYNQTLVATGGTTPYTWAVTAGTLPTGLTLSTAGVISGTPTATGTFNFTVQVTDAASFTATAGLTITVAVVIPSPPTGLTVGTIVASSVPLSWRETPPYTAFRIYRKPIAKTNWTTIATGIKTKSYTDSQKKYKGSYNYEVRAVNNVKGTVYLSSPSNVVTAAIQ